MKFDAFDSLCRANALRILGGFAVTPEDHDIADAQTLVMLGPDEPVFWDVFRASPEFSAPENPMDLWSKRVLGSVATATGGRAIFPSDGPPYAPFFTWAMRTGRCHQSPINLLVHDHAGLMVSFRGALALPFALELPAPPQSPCLTCQAKPCLSACPVEALTPDGYDVPTCKTHIRTQGQDCMQGCLARRACPVSQQFGRQPAQSEFHMRAFVGPN